MPEGSHLLEFAVRACKVDSALVERVQVDLPRPHVAAIDRLDRDTDDDPFVTGWLEPGVSAEELDFPLDDVVDSCWRKHDENAQQILYMDTLKEKLAKRKSTA